MKERRVSRAARWTLGIVALTVIISLGLPLTGARTFLRSDTVLRWAPWNESQPIDLELTSIPVADPVDSGFPAQELFHQRLQDGDFAMWNPFPAGGTPLGAVPHQGLFDPLNLPFLVLPDRMAPAWVKLAELSVAIAGVFLLLRRLGVSQAAALVSGFVYSFSGFQTVWSNWPQSHVGAYLPWLLWAAERLLRRRDFSSCVAISLVTASMLLAGFPALTAWAVGLMLSWVLLRSLNQPQTDRRAMRLIGAAGGSVVLGAGLAAWQLFPFINQIGATDLSHRAQTSADHLSPSLMATAAIPTAFGSHAQGFFYGDRNYIETCAFLGAGALVLAVVAIFWRPSPSVPRSTTAITSSLLAATTVLIFAGGPLLGFAQTLPVFDSNFVGRMRSIWLLLLAILVGLGLEAVASAARGGVDREPSRVSRYRCLGLCVVSAIAVFGIWHVLQRASQEGHLSDVIGAVVIAIAAAVVVIGCVIATRRTRLKDFLPVVVAGVVAIEILLFVSPFWPNEVPERHYPQTPAHDFLAAEATGDRVATHDLALYAGTTTHYKIRTVTGHVFHQPTWRDLLIAVDPEALSRSYTFSFLEFLDVSRLRSTILDRMAVRWLVTQVDFPLPGTPVELSQGDATTRSHPGNPLVVTVQSQPVRGIEIEIAEDVTTTDLAARLRVEIVGPDELVRVGRRHVRGFLPAGRHWIPVAAEDLPVGGEALVRIRLDGDDGVMALRTDDSGGPVLHGMAPSDDGLRLAYADDVAIWENLDAVQRIRFASDGIVVRDQVERIATLQTPLPPEVVVLSDQSNHLTDPEGATAVIHNVDDRLDSVSISLTSTGPGWLVVADAIQSGWSVRVNDVAGTLVHADHALVAVAVPEGSSVVELVYEPSGLRAGVSVSALSLLILLFLVWGASRSRVEDQFSSGSSTSGFG